MAESLTLASEIREGSWVLRRLSGVMDGQAEAPAFAGDPGSHLVYDLHDVRHVSSFGVRDWIKRMRAVREQVAGVYYTRVSPRITDQFNMVVGFDAGGELLSFHTGYYSEASDESSEVLFDLRLDRAYFEKLGAPIRQCFVTGHDASLDDDVSVVFEYARGVQPSTLPPGLIDFLLKKDELGAPVPGLALTARVSRQGDAEVVVLSGRIDASLDVAALLARLGQNRKLRLDLADIRYIDRAGLAVWSKLLSGLGSGVELTRMPPVFLRRLSEDSKWAGGLRIGSVLVPVRSSGSSRVLRWQDVTSAGGTWALSLPHVVWSKEDVALFTDALGGGTGTKAPTPMAASASESGASAADKTAALFDGKYEVLAKLGQGGMASVYLVRQLGAMGFRRIVVIKQVLPDYLTDDRMVRLFLDEARLAARIEHNNVIRVLDLGRADGTYYMVMEYVHGRSVAELLKAQMAAKIKTQPAIAATIVADLCAGLARAHRPDAQGHVLVHRDVTPANVLISFDGVVKLVDFGLAGHKHFAKDELRAGYILGSAPYMSPEIIEGKEPVPQTDIWGAGLLLYALLTGEHPFSRTTPALTWSAILHDSIPRKFFQIPGKLHKVIGKALAKDPKNRYVNAADMERDLRLAAAKLSRGSINLGNWLEGLFAQEVKIENEFIREMKTGSLSDALLAASAEQAQAFFEQLRPGPTGESKDAPPDSPTQAVTSSEVLTQPE